MQHWADMGQTFILNLNSDLIDARANVKESQS